jgi:predicted RNase H-like HicB family nuclease
LVVIRLQLIVGVRLHSTFQVYFGTLEGSMALELTAVFRKDPAGGYVAFVEELPGANTQGETLEEARSNLREAVELVLEANRALANQDADDAEVIRERLTA